MMINRYSIGGFVAGGLIFQGIYHWHWIAIVGAVIWIACIADIIYRSKRNDRTRTTR